MHGAVWYIKHKERDRNLIIKTTGAPHAVPIKINIEEQIMIYPVREKPILKDTYRNLYNIFANINENIYVGIGYSFRDYGVNSALSDMLERNPRFQMFVVNPDSNVINNFPDIKKYKHRFHLVEREFGKEETINELWNKMKPLL